MATVHIRNVGNELVKRLKIEAVERGVTLRELVMERLEGNHGEMREVGGAVQEAQVQKLGMPELRKIADQASEKESDTRPQCPECIVPLFENRKQKVWWCKCGHRQPMRGL